MKPDSENQAILKTPLSLCSVRTCYLHFSGAKHVDKFIASSPVISGRPVFRQFSILDGHTTPQE
ncbi:hypothetical protein PM8797T_16398 [Gimesia maris DSM 8797]|nr:hypothetical protein PM8797T_16398 [Gimesia maris DSM 8797]